MRPPRSYVLRIYRQRTRIAGVIEDVRSGERHVFVTMEDLWAWLKRPLSPKAPPSRGRKAPADEGQPDDSAGTQSFP